MDNFFIKKNNNLYFYEKGEMNLVNVNKSHKRFDTMRENIPLITNKSLIKEGVNKFYYLFGNLNDVKEESGLNRALKKFCTKKYTKQTEAIFHEYSSRFLPINKIQLNKSILIEIDDILNYLPKKIERDMKFEILESLIKLEKYSDFKGKQDLEYEEVPFRYFIDINGEIHCGEDPLDMMLECYISSLEYFLSLINGSRVILGYDQEQLTKSLIKENMKSNKMEWVKLRKSTLSEIDKYDEGLFKIISLNKLANFNITIFETNTCYIKVEAKLAGKKIICIGNQLSEVLKKVSMEIYFFEILNKNIKISGEEQNVQKIIDVEKLFEYKVNILENLPLLFIG